MHLLRLWEEICKGLKSWVIFMGRKLFSNSIWSQVDQWLVTCFPWAGANYIQLLCRIFSLNHPIDEGIQGLHSFHHFPNHFSMGHELLLSEEDCSGDLQTGHNFQAKWYFTLQYFCQLCRTFLSHPQVYLAMFHCQKHTKPQNFIIWKLAFCHFLSTCSMHHRTAAMQQLKWQENDGGLWDLP